ncbi:PilZ domain-containing protein, partial [Shigella sp. FC2125]|uniref:PilZ domain-containing protein n=1 Tax=Shigella sp. FC2125 TaxID=1898679 RepID=UPI0014933481
LPPYQRADATPDRTVGLPAATRSAPRRRRSTVLLDISATGCRLSIKGDQQSCLQTGQVYELSTKLPIGTVQTAVELRHLVIDEKLNTTFCGLRFHRISGPTQRQIERLVYQLQREARRDDAEAPF